MGRASVLEIAAVCLLLGGCGQAHESRRPAGPLAFLASQDSTIAYAVDPAFDPASIGRPALDPPWDSGDNSLRLIGLGEPFGISASLNFGASGSAFSMDISPGGDTALVGVRNATGAGEHALLVVRGLQSRWPIVTDTLPLSRTGPLAIAFSRDGSYALVGGENPGLAEVVVVTGLPGAPAVANTIPLGVTGPALAAVESIDFTPDGRRALVQTMLHQAGSPTFFLPTGTLVVIEDPSGASPAVSSPLTLDATPAVPPPPSLAGRPTGVALGNSAILCDGDGALVPITGALDVGARDARIAIVTGIASGKLSVARVLTPDDGVEISPFAVVVAPDCDTAYVTHPIPGLVTTITGLVSPASANLTLSASRTVYPALHTLAVTPDGAIVVVSHLRAPRDGAAPAAVTRYRVSGRELVPAGSPLVGPVRAWIGFKDHVMTTHPAGLADYIKQFVSTEAAARADASIAHAIAHATDGADCAASRDLAAVRRAIGAELSTGSRAGLVHGLLEVARGRLSCDGR